MKLLLWMMVAGCTGPVVLGARADVGSADMTCVACEDLTSAPTDLQDRLDLSFQDR